MAKNKLIILAGPSCVGKTPLELSLRHLYPDINKRLKRLVAYNSRKPRPQEQEGIDYYFRSTQELRDLAGQNQIILIKARGDLHGFDINELNSILTDTDAFYEGNTFVAQKMISIAQDRNISVQSVFVSPFSRFEFEDLKRDLSRDEMEKYVYNHMLNKLIRRAKNFQITLTAKIMENLRHRARDAWHELGKAQLFNHVIINHDGEDNQNWDDIDNLEGDALIAVHTLAALIDTGTTEGTEDWTGLQF